MPGPRPRALRQMRKLHAATGGKPQHWETLDNLGVVKADAAAIVYSVEKGWILVAPKHDPHSLRTATLGVDAKDGWLAIYRTLAIARAMDGSKPATVTKLGDRRRAPRTLGDLFQQGRVIVPCPPGPRPARPSTTPQGTAS